MANLYQEEHLRRVGSPWNQPSKSRNLLHIPMTLDFGIKLLNKKNSKSLRVFLEALQESPALDYLKARHKVLLPRFSTCFTFVPFVGGLWRAHFGEAEDQATFTNSSSSVEPPCGCPWLSRTAKWYDYTLLVEHGLCLHQELLLNSRLFSSNLRWYYIECLLKMHEWFQLPSLLNGKWQCCIFVLTNFDKIPGAGWTASSVAQSFATACHWHMPLLGSFNSHYFHRG